MDMRAYYILCSNLGEKKPHPSEIFSSFVKSIEDQSKDPETDEMIFSQVVQSFAIKP